MKSKRLALYARVSTKNTGQDPETQLIALREYAAHRGFPITCEYVDIGISGTKDRRPELDRMMTDARRRRFDPNANQSAFGCLREARRAGVALSSGRQAACSERRRILFEYSREARHSPAGGMHCR